MNDRELITGLDVCRAASDDLRQPELRAVAEQIASDPRAREVQSRLDHIDRALSKSMHDVTPSEELQRRLVERLREAAQRRIDDPSSGDSAPSPAAGTRAPGAAAPSRRQWLAWSAGITAAAAAVVAAVIVLRPAAPLQRDHLELARQWHERLSADGDWRPLEGANIEQHALPRQLRAIPSRYRDASAAVGRQARAYDLTLPGGPAATLFVIPQTDQIGLPASPPRNPQSSTLGAGVAYWQSADAIYVVVVESHRSEDYRMLLRTTPPIAA